MLDRAFPHTREQNYQSLIFLCENLKKKKEESWDAKEGTKRFEMEMMRFSLTYHNKFYKKASVWSELSITKFKISVIDNKTVFLSKSKTILVIDNKRGSFKALAN